MEMSITEAKARLTDLVRRAEAGEEVVLTRHGQPVARISAVAKPRLSPEAFDRLIDEIQEDVRRKGLAWPRSTSNHDDLYDEFGLPR